MMISSQILSIPPYLSTPWKNIHSLLAQIDAQKFKLIVILNNGVQVIIPNFDKPTIDSIFEAHARYGAAQETPSLPPGAIALPLNGHLDLMQGATQHNPALSDSAEIPKEILGKIASIAKVLGFEDSSQLPKAEPHCNCPYCQIARAFTGEEKAAKIEEVITDKDLQFRSWDIKQTAENLYQVTNPLDEKEQYSVFLGDPLGCTCGLKNCEHIRAVLNS
ncbi:MAG: hypothetical protein HW387_575 [Parachlamydiales bacterium]|nr:hypothetical protein [Parachlamydiales bacterium]